MNDVKPALLNYRIYFKNGNEIDVLDESNDPSFKDLLMSGKKPVYGQDNKALSVGPATVNDIIPIYAPVCAHCHSRINLHPGENVCSDCGRRTWMGATEH
jgi:hypothetical protein